MLVNKLYFLIVVEVILCAVNGHKHKSSLVFVIDRTSSMSRIIKQVIQETDKVFDAVLKSNSSLIEDFILVTFDDPNTQVMSWTKERSEFKTALYSIKMVNGGNCPEYSISGIEEALKICKPNSFFYVFTDASAADYEKMPIVRSLSQKKAVQVNFLLTGMCKNYKGKYYAVYEELTEATSGQIFHLKKDDITKVINYIIHSIKDKRTILTRKNTRKGETEIQFTVDSKINDVMISISCPSPKYNVTDSAGDVIKTQEVVHTDKSVVDKMTVKPGVYTLHIIEPSSIVISGATTVCFQYGFSLTEPTTMNETSTKPVNGSTDKQYLLIELDNFERDVQLKAVELRDTDDDVLKVLPLKIINEENQLYITEPFKPPNGMFKIAINGLTKSKENITRVSMSTTEYQNPKIEEPPPYTPPVVTILSDSPINIEFNASLTLKCKVLGYPKPDIIWTDNSGSILSSKPVVPVDLYNECISVLEIQKVDKNFTVTCTAVNDKGDKDAKSLEVKTKKKLYLKILEYPKDETVEYTVSAEFKCKVDASPAATISWFKDSEKIDNDKNFNISPDDSVLTIKRMNPKMKGNYYVNVTNSQETKIFQFKVDMSGTEKGNYTPPLVTISPESPVNVEFDAALTLKCTVHAYPTPDITWTDDSGAIVSSKPVVTIKLPYEHVSVLDIEKVNKNMKFTCTAVNIEDDKDAKSVEIKTNKRYFKILEYPTDNKVEYKKSAQFKCKVEAFPAATITWFKNGDKITNGENLKISSDNSVLTITNMSTELKGKYHVDVSNGFDSKVFSFKVTMSASDTEDPKIDKRVSIYKKKIGASVDMSCRVIQGKPKPVISWSFNKDELSSGFVDLKNALSIYHIDNVKTKDGGFYKCEAVNDFNKDSHEIQLIVEYPPSIALVKEIKVREGETVTVDCIVDGSPELSVQWYFKKNEIKFSSKYTIFKNNSLSFMGSVSDSGVYWCTAENGAGRARNRTTIHIYEPVSIEPPDVDVLKLNVGSSKTLHCRVHGNPKPEVKWTLEYHEPKIVSLDIVFDRKTNSYLLDRVQINQQGNYSCIAKNIGGKKKITYSVYVLAAPTIRNRLKSKTLKGVVGDLTLRVPCKASGSPKPTITWKVNGLNIAKDTIWFDIENDGTLIIKNLTLSSQGSYICIATNSLNYATIEYDVQISAYVDTHYKFEEHIQEGSSKEIVCGNIFGVISRPGDYIRWFKNGVFYKEGKLIVSKASDSGIYTCRVSTYSSSDSYTKNVFVGSKPVFTTSYVRKIIEFKEGATEVLDCSARGNPEPRVSWRRGRQSLREKSMIYRLTMTKDNIGIYKCVIENNFGSINQIFEIKNEACVLPKRNDLGRRMPLILSETQRWLLKNTVPIYTKIYILCPGTVLTHDGENLGGYIIAMCKEKNMFITNKKIYDISKMQCKEEIQTTYKSSNKTCRKGNTELVEVGFSLKSEFMSVFDTCIDKDKHKVHFTKYGIHPGIADSVPSEITFDKSDLMPLNFEDIYDCRKQLNSIFASTGQRFSSSEKCCYGRRQLISPMDVLPGISQDATYSYLNVVPIWSSCGTENWDEVERRLRSLVKNKEYKLEVWTGSSHTILFNSGDSRQVELRLNDKKNYQQQVPLYIWKVIINRQEETSLAIILINYPNLTTKEALTLMYRNCDDVCHETNWMKNSEWHNVQKGFVFCCRALEFAKSFDYMNLFRAKLYLDADKQYCVEPHGLHFEKMASKDVTPILNNMLKEKFQKNSSVVTIDHAHRQIERYRMMIVKNIM